MTDHPTSSTPFPLAMLKALIEREHERAELLAVYRLRHRWKASDAPKLRKLKISPVAERRLANLSGRGRPVIAANITPAAKFVQKALHLMTAFKEETSPINRLSSIKKSHWWPHYVEAIYRGEYEALKAKGFSSASEGAEGRIANELGISSAVVRKLCTKIRKLKCEDSDAANFPSARLSDFMDWIQSGKRGNFLPL